MDILLPMFAMIVLTAGVSTLLLVSRLPSIIRHFGHLQGAMHSDELRPKLSPRMRFITDNYNHLFEQPVLFYALVVYLYLSGMADDLQVQMAWLYFLTRMIHSLIHLTSNNVSARALTFVISSMILIGMILRAGLALLFG
jgi:hypothetical protein